MSKLPKYDLANIKFENANFTAKNHTLLVSTPRSGSTFLCTDIDYLDGGAAAEYCQPYQIIPYLMKKRKQIVKDGELSYENYGNYLSNYRSGKKEKLFINIHSHHFHIYQNLKPFLPDLNKVFILYRKNIMKQAISYFIAQENNQWSSNYKKIFVKKPNYNYDKIKEKLIQIYEGSFSNYNRFINYEVENILLEEYLKTKSSFAKLNNVRMSTNEKYKTEEQKSKNKLYYYEQFKSELN